MALDTQAKLLIELAQAAELPDIHTLTPAEARAHYDQRTSDLQATPTVGDVDDRVIPGPAGDLPIRIYRPVGAGDSTPCLLFFHGGGWVIGTIDTHELVCRSLCEKTNATVVSVEYRLAPEHPFPAAPDDCEAATRWVAEHGAEIGVDGSRLAVCGDSAGGNLAAVVTQRCRKGPKIAAQALVYPATDMSDLTRGSLIENAEGYLLTAHAMEWFYGHYIADEADITNPDASPLLGDLSSLPPAIILTAEFDPLRDEGQAYAEALIAAGSEAEHVLYDGQIHTFFTQVGFMEASLDAVTRIAEFVETRW